MWGVVFTACVIFFFSKGSHLERQRLFTSHHNLTHMIAIKTKLKKATNLNPGCIFYSLIINGGPPPIKTVAPLFVCAKALPWQHCSLAHLDPGGKMMMMAYFIGQGEIANSLLRG